MTITNLSPSVETSHPFPTIDSDQIAAVVGGGADDDVCTPENPTGARRPTPPTQFFENDHSGPSFNQRIIDATEPPAGFKLLNGIFGGARGRRPQGPGPWRPEIR